MFPYGTSGTCAFVVAPRRDGQENVICILAYRLKLKMHEYYMS